MIEFSSNSDFLIILVRGKKEFREIELLLLSQSIGHTYQSDFFQKRFFIPISDAEKAKREIELYLKENRNWPPKQYIQKSSGLKFSIMNAILPCILAAFHWTIMQSPLVNAWLNYGRLSAEKVVNGEWWRTITALTLHVDDAHLVSNFFGLVVFVTGVNQFVRSGSAWLMVLLSGAFGNYLNAVFYQHNHNSIGASTAVFGAVGIIGVFGGKQFYYNRQLKKRYFISLIATLGLFAMLGTNPNTDVTAHLFGFAGGISIALIVLPFLKTNWFNSFPTQVVFFAIFGGLIYFSWKIDLFIRLFLL